MKKSIAFIAVVLSALNCNAQKIDDYDLQDLGDIKQVSLMLTKGSEVTLSGFDRSATEMLQPEFFSITGNATAKFTGNDGNYTIYYADNVLYIANPDMKYPETIWITGDGIGHPKNNIRSGWSMDLPKIFMCNRISDNVYRSTLRLDAGFGFKSFKRRSWDADAGYGSNIFTPYPATSIEKAFWIDGVTGNSHPTGDFIPAWDFTPGVYTLEFDVSKGTCCLIELTGEDTPDEIYSINGVTMIKNIIEDHSYYSAELDLKKGERIEFGNIRHLRYLLQPEYFINRGSHYEFAASDGRYKVSYANERELIYVERIDKTSYVDDVLFLTGVNFAHPCHTGAFNEDKSSWGWDKAKDYVCCVTTSEGIYETTLNLLPGFMLRGYSAKGSWDTAVSPDTFEITGDDASGIGGTANFDTSGPGDFNPGTYHIVFDKNNNTALFTRLAPNDFNNGVTTGINEGKNGVKTIVAIYDLQGQKRNEESIAGPGLYIVKYSDGTTSKMFKIK